ncbi:penicillin acylase family protein [Marinobacter litoralis]|uniref:penicillin acylase family protein n=1 Tax=Marinobacter litoralis TaxID=187981 RepID=UPI0018EA9902|nr:penicillin acylase family protein [Marinobacter litoralis]MBJ6138845.1 penicillin acylase family protein [Marinobacter litoralis]
MIQARHLLLAVAISGMTGCFGSGGGSGKESSDGASSGVEAPPKVETPPKNETLPKDDTPPDDVPPEFDGYSAKITRTSYGIPHIEAADFASMGYGYGYVQAEDNLCLLAEDTLTVRGLRSKYLGGGGSYTIPSNGAETGNVDADFFWRSVISNEALESLKNESDPEVLAASQGFVDGYNRYLEEIRVGEHSGRHEDCRNSDWLLPITLDDMFRRYFRLAILASSSVFVEGIANAQPPAPGTPVPPELSEDDIAKLTENSASLPFPMSRALPIGSNMYAFSKDATRDGQSLLFGNPHFPWEKTERLYLAHLKVADKAEIMGAALYGLPAVLIGFNEHFAWSHTVSTAYRFTFYELTLNPADATQYLYNGEFVDMTSTEITVEVLQPDGSVTEEIRTLYHSQYGPMLQYEVSGVPVLSWTPAKAYTLRDANAENNRMLNQFFRWNQASSFDEFKDLHASVLGVPWVNTIATGPGQPAYYGDLTVVPHVTDTQALECSSSISPAFALLAPGLPVLDGSRPDCAWGTDNDAPAEGVFGPENLPSLVRNDWVHNCNDSYWLTNPDEPLTGYASIIGDEETARTLRTRLCIKQVEERLSGSDGGAGTLGFDMSNLQDIVLSSAVMSERLARDAVLTTYCSSEASAGKDLSPGSGVDASVGVGAGADLPEQTRTEACNALAKWDGQYNLDSRGGHIWREFWRRINLLPVGPDLKWVVPFLVEDPVNTPNTFNAANPAAIKAFAEAIQAVEDSGVPFDAELREIQYSGIHEGDRIPVFGGESFEGAFTIAATKGVGLADGKEYPVTYGNSYIQTVTWREDGTPLAEGFVTYSQSTDPASPYYRDMTESYAEKNWIRFPYTDADISADPDQKTMTLQAPFTTAKP